MVNFDDMSKESIENAYKEKFGKDLNSEKEEEEEEEEEDYTVKNYENIEIDEECKNLIFGNECRIFSMEGGDGVLVREEFVKAITQENNCFMIYLKGSTEDYSNEEILYEYKEREKE